MEKLLDWAETFGLPMKDEATATAFYQASLADLPEDLLMEAIKLTIVNHQYHTLPKPADIRKHVSEDYARRKVTLMRAKAALKFGR